MIAPEKRGDTRPCETRRPQIRNRGAYSMKARKIVC